MPALRKLAHAIVPAAILLLASAAASASVVTYTFTGTGSGSLGLTAFTDAAYVFTQVADTDDITSCTNACTLVESTSASIQIAGVGTFAFTSPLLTFSNYLSSGISRGGNDDDDLIEFSPSVAPSSDYSLSGSLATVSGQSALLQWGSGFATVITSGGALSFDDSTGPATFGSAVSAVPEPASIALLLAGLGLFGVTARRRRG